MKSRWFGYAALLVVGLLFSTVSDARYVYHSGYYHTGYYHGGANYYHGGYYHGGYYDAGWGWGAPGVFIGVPSATYYGYGCRVVQNCYSSGCVNERICN